MSAKGMQTDNFDQALKVISGLFILLVLVLVWPGIALFKGRHQMVKYLIEITKYQVYRVHFGFVVTSLTLYYGTVYLYSSGMNPVLQVVSSIIGLWTTVLWIGFSQRNLLIKSLKAKRLVEPLRANAVKNEKDYIRKQVKKDAVYLGKSKVDGLDIALPTAKRSYHSLIVGASGHGKTSLLKVLTSHSFIHGNPCLLVDPKGDFELQEDIKTLFAGLNPAKDSRNLHFFRFGDPKNSIKYNPLKYGDTTNLVETIMSSFEFSEQFYENACKDFLTSSIQLIRDLGEVVTFEKLSLLEKKEEFYLSQVAKKIKSSTNSDYRTELMELFETIDKLDRKLLVGLKNQLSFYTQKEVASQFNPSDDDVQIDLRDIYTNGDVLLVDLNTNNNKDAGRLIGKFLSNDILRLSSQIGQKTIPKRADDFMVYLDEFSSIAGIKAEDMLQKCRSAGVALHLFVQTFEEYTKGNRSDELSSVLTAMLGNTFFKFIFKSSIPGDVDLLCNQIGTRDVEKFSHNVLQNFFGKEKKTGVGMAVMTKEFKVEHDLVKSLEPGECVVYAGNELNNNPELASIWNVKTRDLLYWQTDYQRIWNESHRGELSFNFPLESY